MSIPPWPALAAIALLLAATAAATDIEATTPLEPTPDELEAELDAQLAAGDVQLFSTTPAGRRSILSEMGRELRETFSFAVGPPTSPVEVYVFKNPRGLGIDAEFAVVSIDGAPVDAYVISTAAAGRRTVEGRYRLDFLVVRGTASPAGKPYPWKRSKKYWQSPMFWGLRIYEGWWIHSTPHYDDLGRPASMGCVRLTFPAAMELWDAVVNRYDGDASITIFASGSADARKTLERLGIDTGWIRERIDRDLGDAHAVTTHEYDGVGHARRNAPLVWPSCRDVDCFDYFGKRRPGA
jgi:hypothetical protein